MVKVADRQLSYTSSSRENVWFMIKCFLFMGSLFIWFNIIEPEYLYGYNASLIDKVDRLESIDDPKIVLIGNSNLVFGMNSELLEREIGMPVVNMGLHAGLGNAFHEEMAKLNVAEGDIYIICHSDYNDNGTIGNAELAWITIENHFSLWRLISHKDILSMIRAFPVYLRKSIDLYTSFEGNIDAGGRYSRSGFNEYGDCNIYREGSVWTKIDPVGCPGVSEECVERLNALNFYLSQKGATLLIAGYPIGNGEVTDDKKLFEDFQRELEEGVDCQVISDFTDYMYDYSYFYDYNFLHLNTEGARIRSEQLIKDLRKWGGLN